RSGSLNEASWSNALSPTTARATAPGLGEMHALTWASSTSDPDPTGPRPTARSNASTALWAMAGLTRSSIPPQRHATKPYLDGFTSTITTDPTPPSEASHQSPD